MSINHKINRNSRIAATKYLFRNDSAYVKEFQLTVAQNNDFTYPSKDFRKPGKTHCFIGMRNR